MSDHDSFDCERSVQPSSACIDCIHDSFDFGRCVQCFRITSRKDRHAASMIFEARLNTATPVAHAALMACKMFLSGTMTTAVVELTDTDLAISFDLEINETHETATRLLVPRNSVASVAQATAIKRTTVRGVEIATVVARDAVTIFLGDLMTAAEVIAVKDDVLRACFRKDDAEVHATVTVWL